MQSSNYLRRGARQSVCPTLLDAEASGLNNDIHRPGLIFSVCEADHVVLSQAQLHGVPITGHGINPITRCGIRSRLNWSTVDPFLK